MRFLLLFFLILSTKSLAQQPIENQDILVDMKELVGFGNKTHNISLSSLQFDENFPQEYRGIPKDLDSYRIFGYYFQYELYQYQRFKKGLLSAEEFGMIYNRYKIDTTRFTQREIGNRLNILCGLRGGKKIIMADSNNDGTFEEDYYYEIDTAHLNAVDFEKARANIETISVNYEYYNGFEIMGKVALVKIFPYHSNDQNKTSLQKAYSIHIQTNQVRLGFFKIHGEQYKVVLKKFIIFPYLIFEKEGEPINRATILPGDSIKLGQHFMYIQSLNKSEDSLVLKYLGKDKKFTGKNVGFYAPDVSLKTLDGEIINLNKTKGKYILMDFWGTWCKPCIEDIPRLRILNEKYASQGLELLSVAYDKDSDKVREFINNNNMPWKHAYNPRVEGAGIVGLMGIEFFPTLILIDPDGRIIAREGHDLNNIEKALLEDMEKQKK